MGNVNWKLDESNEVAFKVDISSTEPIHGTPKVRLVCESRGIDYAFPGQFNGQGEVEVTVPPMEGKLDEGQYRAKLEVILEDKYFVPLEFDANFQVTTKVVAEMVQKESYEEDQIVKASMVSKPIIQEFKTKEPQPKPRRQKKATKETQKSRLKSLKEKFGK